MNASVVDDLRPRQPEGLSRAAGLALLAHALLVVALSLSVSWRTSEPAGVEAELWAAVPQVAAPRAVEPEPTPPTPPKPTPTPPQPTPKVEPPPPPPDRDADIAREKREQKEKLEKQRQDEERKEAARKEEARKAALEKQQQQQEEAQAKAEADKKKKAEAARQAAQAEALRKENLKRIMGQADATGAPDSTGTAAQSAGPSSSYAGRIKARIKPNVVFADEVAGNPMASVEVKVAPDGTILGRRLVKSSGLQAWDDAVLRAIDKTEVLPRDTDGRVPSSMVIDFRPRDF